MESHHVELPAPHEDIAPIAVACHAASMEIWISYVLRIGVLLAASIILVGVGLFVLEGPRPGDPTTISGLLHKETHATSPGTILHGVAAGRPTSLVRLGVLVLILTPIARVTMTVGLFFAERDWIFTLLTMFVLVVLVIGLIGFGV